MLKGKIFILLIFALQANAAYAAELFSKEEFPKTDFSKHTVPLNELYTGGPPRDEINPIDEPAFIRVKEASEIYDDREPVVAVCIGDKERLIRYAFCCITKLLMMS